MGAEEMARRRILCRRLGCAITSITCPPFCASTFWWYHTISWPILYDAAAFLPMLLACLLAVNGTGTFVAGA
jgi:hypothetical protein